MAKRKRSREGTFFPDYNASGFSHDPEAGFSMFLQERCKRVFFIRHAEGTHNTAVDESTFEPPELILLKRNTGMTHWDARLTEKGVRQCRGLKASIRGNSVWGYAKPLNLDLVVVSPLTRTLQTAVLALGDPQSPGAPPFVANELCRERVAHFMCDGRRNKSELEAEFPGVDFSLVECEEDWIFETQKENDEICQARCREFLKWLCGRPEIHIAVVTHSVFLNNLLQQFGNQLSEEDRWAMQEFPSNAEMRAVMLCAHHKFDSTVSDKEKRPPTTDSMLWDGSIWKYRPESQWYQVNHGAVQQVEPHPSSS
jgi:broad specificity phosphatase PhoE